MNSVKLLYIKCCFFNFFNSPVALKNKKKIWPPQEKVEMMPLRAPLIVLVCWYDEPRCKLVDVNRAPLIVLVCWHDEPRCKLVDVNRILFVDRVSNLPLAIDQSHFKTVDYAEQKCPMSPMFAGPQSARWAHICTVGHYRSIGPHAHSIEHAKHRINLRKT